MILYNFWGIFKGGWGFFLGCVIYIWIINWGKFLIIFNWNWICILFFYVN